MEYCGEMERCNYILEHRVFHTTIIKYTFEEEGFNLAIVCEKGFFIGGVLYSFED